MPTHNQDLGQLSTRQLSELTGCAHLTVRKRLRAKGIKPVGKDGRTLRYHPPTALPVILEVGEGLNPAAEKAGLDKARREAQEMKNMLDRRELISPEEMDRSILGFASILKSRLRGLGMSLSSRVAGESKPALCKGMIDEAVSEALSELADEAEACKARLEAKPRKGNGKPTPESG